MKRCFLLIIAFVLFSSYQPKSLSNAEEAQKHYDKAINHYTEGNYEKAIEAFKTGVEFLPSDTLERARYYSNIGLFHALLLSPPQYNQAIQYYEKSIAIREKHNDLPGDDCKETGRLYAEIGEYSKSLIFYKKAIPYLKQQENSPNELALTYVELGDKVYRSEGKYQEAIETLELAEQLWKPNAEQNKAAVYIGLGNVYHDKQSYEKAIEYYQIGLNHLKDYTHQAQNDVSLDIARSLNNIGTTYTKLKKWKQAISFLFRALNKKLELGKAYTSSIASSYNNIGEFYLDKNQLDSAYQYYQHAIRLVNDTTASLQLSKTYRTESTSFPTAVQMQNSNAKPNLVIYLKDQARCFNAWYQQTNNAQYLEKAFQTYQTLDTLVHILLDNITEESQYVWIQKVRDIYENAIQVSLQLYELKKDKRYLKTAFSFAESNKAVVLYKAIQRNNFKTQEHSSNILADIQEKLSRKDALIEYFVGKKDIYIFQVSRTDIQLKTIQKSEKLEQQIEQFNQFISAYEQKTTISVEQYWQIGHQLYQELLPQNAKQYNRLIIVPDDNLYYISFAALLTEPTTDNKKTYNLPYLIKNCQINYGFSTAILLNSLQQNKNTQPFDLKIYAPSFTKIKKKYPNLTTLKARDKTIHALQNLLNAALDTGEISVQHFYDTYQKHKTLYFATHAKVSSDSSYLIFSDKVLSTNELYQNLDFNQQNIILGACETGLGTLQKGEGIMNFTRAFMYKGSSNVVSSLWKIDDEVTNKILTNYFELQKAGKPSDTALHQAQINYLNGSNRLHPKYWAAFTHTGAWSVDKSSFFNRRSLVFLIGIVLMVGLFFWWKRRQKS